MEAISQTNFNLRHRSTSMDFGVRAQKNPTKLIYAVVGTVQLTVNSGTNVSFSGLVFSLT